MMTTYVVPYSLQWGFIHQKNRNGTSATSTVQYGIHERRGPTFVFQDWELRFPRFRHIGFLLTLSIPGLYGHVVQYACEQTLADVRRLDRGGPLTLTIEKAVGCHKWIKSKIKTPKSLNVRPWILKEMGILYQI